MITETDLKLANSFLPQFAGKKDIVSTKKVNATAKAIAQAMLPERAALIALTQRLQEVQADPTFKEVFAAANRQGVRFMGTPWKDDLAAAQAIVDTYPVPDPSA